MTQPPIDAEVEAGAGAQRSLRDALLSSTFKWYRSLMTAVQTFAVTTRAGLTKEERDEQIGSKRQLLCVTSCDASICMTLETWSRMILKLLMLRMFLSGWNLPTKHETMMRNTETQCEVWSHRDVNPFYVCVNDDKSMSCMHTAPRSSKGCIWCLSDALSPGWCFALSLQDIDGMEGFVYIYLRMRCRCLRTRLFSAQIIPLCPSNSVGSALYHLHNQIIGTSTTYDCDRGIYQLLQRRIIFRWFVYEWGTLTLFWG